MRIALLISGRATSYEKCLLPILEQEDEIVVDLFMAINNTECEYFEVMRGRLKKWLVYCDVKEFEYPKETVWENTLTDKYQKVGDKFIPYNALSMFYHDNKAFKEATKYADENGFEYDYYMKYRSDINDSKLPRINNMEDDIVYCAKPLYVFKSRGIHKQDWVSDAIAFGRRGPMSVYCNTYDFVINKNKELNNKYYIAYEDSLTDCLLENGVNYKYENIPYALDYNRRMFDKHLTYRHNNGKGVIQKDLNCDDCLNDSNGLVGLDITQTKDTKHIEIKKRTT